VARDDLTRMANQIAAFFAPYPEADAIAGVLDHLEKFWDPSMRRELITIASRHLDTALRDGNNPPPALHPLVLRAAARLKRPTTECL
jgi:formate dehydrogenase subunit delta